MLCRSLLEAELTRDMKWLNSATKLHRGTLEEIRQYIPSFERREFGLIQDDNRTTRLNQRLDIIVRQPTRNDPGFVPVGVVSKEYALVQHDAIVNTATKALKLVNVGPNEVTAEIRITEYGERMGLSLYFPERFDFNPGDGEPIGLRLECLNSVDGSTRFRALMGWYRFVCSNGMAIGVTRMNVRRRHIGEIDVEEIGDVLRAGFEEAEADKLNFKKWREMPINPMALEAWVNTTLRDGWGFKAAARAYHIAQTGFDGKINGQYKGKKPSTIQMETTNRVPGTPDECKNLFELSQILAWLAKERRDLQEQIEWREKIPDLVKEYLD